MNALLPVCPELGEALDEVCRLKFAAAGQLGWSPRMRQRFGYFTPDEWYEAILFRLIGNETEWLDVGCGHHLFPSNKPLAELLSARARTLVGLDPSDNIERNELVHERAKCRLEEYRTKRQFDLISLRMVAEHISDPGAAVAMLSRLTRGGGRVVVYTVSKWTPSSIAAALTPMAVHHTVKRLLWRTPPEDTFPTVYRMNTRSELRNLFVAEGFAEEGFLHLDDCRGLGRWRSGLRLELTAQKALRRIGLRYPDVCLVGIYRKQEAATASRAL